MARFEEAVEVVLEHEGGFVDHPADPGGATAFGISLRFLRGLEDLDGDGIPDGDLNRDGTVDVRDVRDMTPERAAKAYRSFWIPAYCFLDQQLANKVFDLAVNMGAVPAHRVLQRAVCACGRDIAVDGRLGLQTMSAVAAINPVQLLAAVRSEAAGFYRTLAAKRPDLRCFLAGWTARAYSA